MATRSTGFPDPYPMKTIHLTSPLRQEIQLRRQTTPDRRVYERLCAVLWADEGLNRGTIADLLGRSRRLGGDWLRIFRNKGLDALCTLHYKGDPGKLTPRQIEQLKQQIKTGRFHNSDQIRLWVEETFHVQYASSGIKDLLRRVGASYHKVTGFFWKADPKKQRLFVRKYKRHKAEVKYKGTTRVRRYCIDACHPIWGMDLVYRCWLLVGQQFLVGVGNGRKRLNILGAYCPDDQEYLDMRLTRDNINGEQFVNLLRLIRANHPRTEKFILYVDRARYYSKPVVQEWLQRHPEFRLEPLPTYSPNLNLIERLWKFLRKKALSRWHKTFEAMQQAVSEVLDHLQDYRAELTTLMSEKFAIVPEAARAEACAAA
jgi:transposase